MESESASSYLIPQFWAKVWPPTLLYILIEMNLFSLLWGPIPDTHLILKLIQ